MKIFIYGSIKKGFYNHERFGFHKLPFLGKHTLKQWQMISLGSYPGILPGNEEDKVEGELYEIAEESNEFKFMDMVENGAGYRLHPAEKGKTAKDNIHTYYYRGGLSDGPKIPDGIWKG